MDSWQNGIMAKWIHGKMDPFWIHTWQNGFMAKWIHDKWIQKKLGFMEKCIHGSLDSWHNGCVAVWIHGTMDE